MKIKEDLWGIIESPKQAELLVKAIRLAELMADTPYWAVGKNGAYEVAPNGKAASPLVQAIRMGAPPEAIKLLLVEAERKSLEWANKKEDENPKENKDTVV